jgi:hypothetical protein
MIRRLRGDRGQSVVELVALLPLVMLIGLGVLTLLIARSAEDDAASAAQAGAMAMLQAGDPAEAARTALPAGARARASVRVVGRTVTVVVRPRTPMSFLRNLLVASASAHAGPEPAP